MKSKEDLKMGSVSNKVQDSDSFVKFCFVCGILVCNES